MKNGNMDELFEGQIIPAANETAAPAASSSGHYVVYARKWRPQTFEEVVGQGHVAEALHAAISKQRIGHAYLFTGPRGVGKTSTARILAKSLNCLSADAPTPKPCGKCDQCRTVTNGSNLDVIEIDGASNNRVEEVRELRENVNYTPFAGRYKVYIIDEVHMLSTAAFNALLKTLEEPPPRIVFVLATTEMHKIPATIVSRCQVYEFKSISTADIIHRLNYIIDKEQVSVKADERQTILETIAHCAEGGMRDAQVALDQAITFSEGELTLAEVQDLLGLVGHDVCVQMITGIREGDIGGLLMLVDQIISQGRDLARVVKQAMQFTRDLLILINAGPESKLVQCPRDQLEAMNELTGTVSSPFLLNLSHRLVELDAALRGTAPHRYLVELALIELASVAGQLDASALIDEIDRLKRALAEGGLKPPTAASPAAPPAQASAVKPEDRGAIMRDSAPLRPATASATTPQPSTLDPVQLWNAVVAEARQADPELGAQLAAVTPVAMEKDFLRVDLSNAGDLADLLAGDTQQAQLVRSILEETAGRPLRVAHAESSTATVADTSASAPSASDAEDEEDDEDSGASHAHHAEEEARMAERLEKMLATQENPDQRAAELLEHHPDFRQQVKQALQALNGGAILRIDGVSLSKPLRGV
ncbi:DNA polymerase III subunit gamma/tau [Candidatus Sumerlaeota bacterium]|nr:DNA polymerase III subunit gamma/tau [Candidatus Sumerlaeota bacterium]